MCFRLDLRNTMLRPRRNQSKIYNNYPSTYYPINTSDSKLEPLISGYVGRR